MPSISLVMVVKDEGRTLAGAVQSVASVVSEVVIGVDDSCTDDTPAIARQLASPGKLFSFHFEDDFSAIRNEGIKRADGDVVLIMDGHEFIAPDDHPVAPAMARMRGYAANDRVPTPLATLKYIQEHGFQGDAKVCCITCGMNSDPCGVPQLFFLQPRLFLNDGKICYQNKVHNALAGYARDETIAYRDLILVHNMPPTREEQRKVQRKKMNASGLFASVKQARAFDREYRKEHGTLPPLGQRNGRPFFYLGNTYADQGDYVRSLYWYKEYLPRSGFGDEHYQAFQQLAIMTYRVHKDVDKAIAYTQEAERLCYNRAEPFVLRAEICMDQGDWAQAIHWLDRADTMPAPDTVMFLQGPVYSYLPAYQKARCHVELKDWPAAIKEYESVLSWRQGDPEIIKAIMQCKNKLRRQQDKPNVLFVDRIGSFSTPMAQHYADQGWAVVKREACDLRWKGWADLAWFEWVDGNILEWSQEPWDCPVVCRLHSYEAYTDYPGQVQWGNVSHLVFVSEHIRKLVLARWPQIAEQTKTSVIYNGVDPDKYTWSHHGPGNKIAFLGYLNSKKNIGELIALFRMYPEYEWHIGGTPQEGNMWDDFQFQIADLHNVWVHGWIANGNDWLNDMDFLVSPSIIESFGLTIAEAALKGIKPVVRHRLGTSDLWPEQWIYKGVEDFRRVLEGPYDPEFNRQWIVDRYTLKQQLEKTDALVNGLLAGTRPPESTKYVNCALVTSLDTCGAGGSLRSLSMDDDPAHSLVV